MTRRTLRLARHLQVWSLQALLLLALIVRGAIPAGYMPTDTRHSPAALISLCVSPANEAQALAALAGLVSPSLPSEDAAAMQACTFAIVAHQALDLPPSGLVLQALHTGSLLPLPPFRQQPGLYISRTGPPIGARAPPNVFS